MCTVGIATPMEKSYGPFLLYYEQLRINTGITLAAEIYVPMTGRVHTAVSDLEWHRS